MRPSSNPAATAYFPFDSCATGPDAFKNRSALSLWYKYVKNKNGIIV